MKGSQSVHIDLFTTRQTTIQGLSKQVPYVYDHDDPGVHGAKKLAFSSMLDLWANVPLEWPNVQKAAHGVSRHSCSTEDQRVAGYHIGPKVRPSCRGTLAIQIPPEEHTCRCGIRKSAPILVGERESVLKGMRADDDWWQIMNSCFSRASMGNL
jgi:hypothetical protein